MINNEIGTQIVYISLSLAFIISAIGWLIKESKKSYIILWLGVIPLIISKIFLFLTKSYYDNIFILIMMLILYIIYILFLIIKTYEFIKLKEKNPEIEEQINNTIELIDNNISLQSN